MKPKVKKATTTETPAKSAKPSLQIGSIVSDNGREASFVVTHIEGDAFIGLAITGKHITAGFKYGCDLTDIDTVSPLTVFEIADSLRGKGRKNR